MSGTKARRLFREALREMGVDLIPDSMLSDLVEAIRVAGEQRGYVEAYDHYMATRTKGHEQEQQLAAQCRILVTQIERLIRVNRYLFAILGDTQSRKHTRTMAQALKLFTKEPSVYGVVVKRRKPPSR